MAKLYNPGELSGQRGSALVLVIFVLAVLGVMGIVLVTVSQHEAEMSRSDTQSKQSFYLAEAGIEHARLVLYAQNKNASFDDDLLEASGGVAGNGTIDLDPDGIVPQLDGGGNLIGFSAGVGDDRPLVGITSLAGGAYASFLSNDPVDPSSVDDQNERVVLTGVGVGDGGATEVVQAIIEKQSLLFSDPPATITLLGPNPGWTPGNSNAKLYDGNDCGGTGFVPTVGVIGPTAEAAVESNQGKPTYRSGGLTPEESIEDLLTPSHPGVANPIDPGWTDCLALRDMIEQIRGVADVVCTNNACTLPPSSPSRIVFADCDFNLNGGEGLVVVTGRLNLAGNVNWNGIVLAVGEGLVQRSGGGNGSVMGAFVIADIAGPDNVYGTSDDCTGSPDGFGSAQWQTNGGGNSTVGYCGATIQAANPPALYRITQFLQR